MKHYDLGTIKKVDLKSVWPHEALDFTKWLAEESSLAMLSQAVGMDLELREVESAVGSFRADIYATDTATNARVIIENQLEDTNHDHLGKIITYAAGKDAQAVIWIVRHARDEHRQAIEWLNARTDDEAAFFLVEIEVWSIGGSLPAPRFNVVEQPNEWARTVKASEGMSETDKIKLAYWTRYREVAEATPEFMKEFSPRKPAKDHWSTLSCGSSAYHMALLIDTQGDRTGVEFYVPDDKEIGHKAIANKSIFEQRLGLKAKEFDATKASGIRLYRPGRAIRTQQDKWDVFIREQLSWALEMKKIIKELEL